MKKKLVSGSWQRVIWISAASLVWALVLAFDLLPILRGAYDWEWSYMPTLNPTRIVPLTIGILCYVPVALSLAGRGSSKSLLLWSIAGGIGMALGAVHVRGDILYRLYSLTASGRASGWHMAAARLDNLGSALLDWPGFMQETASFSPHIDHSPPGMVMLYYAAGKYLDMLPPLADRLAAPLRWLLCQYLVGYTSGDHASAWIGISTPVWASLTVLPLYFLGRSVFGDRAARWAAIWWPLVPSALIFAPLPYTSFAMPAIIMITVLWHGLKNDRALAILFAGLLLSVMTFFNFVFLPLALFAGLLALGVFWLRLHGSSSERLPWSWLLRAALWFAIGLAAIWILFYAATGTSLMKIWAVVQETQRPVSLSRPYAPFLALNLNDLFMFTGWPIALLAALGIWQAAKRLVAGASVEAGDVMTGAATLTLILLDLAGTPRGETGRLLLFLVPWLLLAAGTAIGSHAAGGTLITLVQALAATVVIVCLNVVGPEFRGRAAPMVPASRMPAVKPASIQVSALLDDSARLLTVEGRVDSRITPAGQNRTSLDLWMTWEALKPADVHYSYSFRLLDSELTPSGAVLLAAPFAESYPMSCWKPEDGLLHDRVRLSLPAGQGQEWWVDFSVVDDRTSATAVWLTAEDLKQHVLRLGPFSP